MSEYHFNPLEPTRSFQQLELDTFELDNGVPEGTTIDGEFIDWARRPTIMSAGAMYMVATMGVVGLRVLSYLVRLIWPGVWTPLVSQSVSAAVQLLLLLLPVLVYRREHPGVDSALRLRLPKLQSVLVTVAAAACGLLLSDNIGLLWGMFIQFLGGRFQGATLTIAPGILPVISAFVMMAVVPAVSEELLFRGHIMGAFERHGTARALTISSILFGLLHGSVESLPIQLMMGFVIGYLVIATDSIVIGMLYHFVHNAGSIAISLISGVDRPLPGETLFQLNGGIYGVMICLLRIVLLLGMFVVLLIAASSEREQAGRSFMRTRSLGKELMNWRELLVMMSGLVATSMLLIIGVLKIMRVV